ncbi:SIMPL domain-containing protein [Paenibacillus sp. SYP-B3998]|uniref:SIMPL domain-containing protein n=1 Tax=Paenibacillus sp. SYP-B3998 TaxID=2678564 RepID=A0A6G3ZRS1_9BACL|nr:SIMPL domain-containing protein [Paenibacillus sp. SYP-B3998]NEW04906.1 SIMPL domain-containing protein [Paenibacillus sp. SYP-B3998]
MNRKVKYSFYVGFFVVLLAFFMYSNLNPLNSKPAFAATSETEKHAISVVGEGELTLTPDVAYITLGIVTKADTANNAQTKNAQSFANLEKVFYDTYKFDKKDVKTTGFQVQPVYSYDDKEPKITGYTATQTVQLTYRDMDKIGLLLDSASDAGANQINGVQFDTEKRQEYEIQAIDKAMSNAQNKAKAIAKNASKELKGVMNVTLNGSYASPIYFDNVSSIAMKQSTASNAATSISAGELKIKTSVSVQYDFQ